jgi:uncharacterized membrane protein HdeD (DUF308 family)
MMKGSRVPVSPAASFTERYWVLLVVRAALALIPGLIVAFVPDHSAAAGLLFFGTWATITGVVVGAAAMQTVTGVPRTLFLVNGIVTAVAGITALALQGASLALFLYIVSVWAAVTGFIELYAGLRERRAGAGSASASVARDWIAVGAFTAILAIAYLLMPPNAVVAVGILGAYLVIIAVYLGIAGLSLRWDGARTTSETEKPA